MRPVWARVAIAAVVTIASSVTAMPVPASAQVLDVCGTSVTEPSAPFGGHEVSASGSYTCGRTQDVVTVFVCLGPLGAPARCNGSTVEDEASATAEVSFPCVPGVWFVEAFGQSSQSAGEAATKFAVIPSCDPLRP